MSFVFTVLLAFQTVSFLACVPNNSIVWPPKIAGTVNMNTRQRQAVSHSMNVSTSQPLLHNTHAYTVLLLYTIPFRFIFMLYLRRSRSCSRC